MPKQPPKSDVKAPLPAAPTPIPGQTGTKILPTQLQPVGEQAPGITLESPLFPDEIGRLAGYRVLRMIGQGGMAVVYEAEDAVLKRRVAIKVMKPEIAGDAEAQGRFLIEAQAAAALHNDHVVTIHQVGEENGMPFLVMPLLQGETLHDRLKRKPRPTIAEAVKIGREIAAGLTAAHASGLVHRDIKPANLWLEAPNGRALILDFGLARLGQTGGEFTRQGQVLGTPAFMAPEQARGEPVDFRADLFSLGAVLYVLTSGREPFQGGDVWSLLYKVVHEHPAPPAELNPNVPTTLSELIMRLLAKEPDARPKSAAAVVVALHAIRVAIGKKNTDPKLGAKEPAPSKSLVTKKSSDLPTPVNESAKPVATVLPEVRPGTRIGVESKAAGNSALNRRSGPRAFFSVLGAFALIALVTGIWLWSRRVPIVAVEPPRVHSVGAPASGTTRIQIAWAEHLEKPVVESVDLGRGVKMDFVLIPPGEFWMGAANGEKDAREEEKPRQLVRISKAFYLGRYEVTQEQYHVLTGTNPSKYQDFQSQQLPVENLSWLEADAFCDKLTLKVGRKFTLPTESEWEYACRGGTTTPFFFGAALNGTQANCNGENPYGTTKRGPHLKRPCSVGSYATVAPHPWGLCDMHGNVWEWCRDGPRKYKNQPVTDPIGPTDVGSDRVNRGGSWRNEGSNCRSTDRDVRSPSFRADTIGFRVALPGE